MTAPQSHGKLENIARSQALPACGVIGCFQNHQPFSRIGPIPMERLIQSAANAFLQSLPRHGKQSSNAPRRTTNVMRSGSTCCTGRTAAQVGPGIDRPLHKCLTIFLCEAHYCRSDRTVQSQPAGLSIAARENDGRYTEEAIKPLPPPPVSGKIEAERFDNACEPCSQSRRQRLTAARPNGSGSTKNRLVRSRAGPVRERAARREPHCSV